MEFPLTHIPKKHLHIRYDLAYIYWNYLNEIACLGKSCQFLFQMP